MKIILGTTSPQKISYFNEVISILNIIADIETIDVSSDVSDQPFSSKETKQGSINRAKKAFSQSSDADIAVGIEFGYESNKNKDIEIFCWTTIVDRNNRQLSSRSHKLFLPDFHKQILKEGKNLGDYVRQYLTENPDPLSQHIGVIIRDRKPFIQTSIESALLNYFVK